MNIIEKVAKYPAECEVEKLKINEKIKENIFNLEEMKSHKELHYMKCPKCGMSLNEIEYKEGKIDKCTECDGIWLDARELEALLLNEKTLTENIYRTLMRQLY